MSSAVPERLADQIIPYLMINGAADAIAFYERAFSARLDYSLNLPDGKVAHAEINVFGAPVYVADAPDEMPGLAGNPVKLGGTTVLLHVYVPDVDAAIAQAADAGAVVLREPADQFYGDRAAMVADPYGHQWSLHTRLVDMTPEEMEAAMAEMMANMPSEG